MEDDPIIQMIRDNPIIPFFLALGVGYFIGRLKFKGFELGASAGVLIVGLLLGHLGFTAPDNLKDIGFIIFIYAVGLQAGPRFFSILLSDGWKYITLAFVTAGVAFGTAYLLANFLDLEYGLSAGLMAGALTSTPTLAAAQDAVNSGIATLPKAFSASDAVNNVTVAYAITYIFGTVGLMMAAKLLPRFLGINLAGQASAAAKDLKMEEPKEASSERESSLRAYRVTKLEIIGRPLRELALTTKYDCGVLLIKRGQERLTPNADSTLQEGDRIAIGTKIERLEEVSQLFGPAIYDKDLLSNRIEYRRVVVTSSMVAGKDLSELRTPSRYTVTIQSIIRSQVELPVEADTVLQKGDVLNVAGMALHLERFVKDFGMEEAKIQQTDLVTFSLGIVAGLLLSGIGITLFGISITLGMSGGLLLAGILVGFFRANHPTFGMLPSAARWVLMEMGLMFFMAAVGLSAGKDIVEALTSFGPSIFLAGIAVTLLPLLLSYAFGRLILRLNPAVLLGAITGAMTSTPALSIICEESKSSVPALGYAGTYAFANVILTVAGTLMMVL